MNLTHEQTALLKKANAHNESIDHFIHVTLKDHFGADTLNMKQWFEAQHLISEQRFYDKGYPILEALRATGIDCKMDMQSNKLHCPQIGIYAY